LEGICKGETGTACEPVGGFPPGIGNTGSGGVQNKGNRRIGEGRVKKSSFLTRSGASHDEQKKELGRSACNLEKGSVEEEKKHHRRKGGPAEPNDSRPAPQSEKSVGVANNHSGGGNFPEREGEDAKKGGVLSWVS